MIFRDRQQAGKLLADKLAERPWKNAIVIGLARGGVMVAAQISHKLSFPLDVLVVKKSPSPPNPELALGALAPEGVFVVDWRLTQRLGADEDYIKRQIARLGEEIKQKTLVYRRGKKPLAVKGQTVILVDDGVATGATAQAAIKWCKKKGAAQIGLALPVISPEAVARLRSEVTELVALDTPFDLGAVGQFYKHFEQVTDDEVIELLRDGKTVRQ
ncbi:MAG: phosphoribosyltransferase [Patescibacteria group bacterium]